MKNESMSNCLAPVAVILFATIFFTQANAVEVAKPKVLTTAKLTAALKGRCASSIPSGFDWPVAPEELYKMSGGFQSATLNIPGAIDIEAQRKHGWKLFAGLTQPASKTPGSPPIFHTWYTVEEAFDPADRKVQCETRVPAFRVSLPTQLLMEANGPLKQELRGKGQIRPPDLILNLHYC